MPKGRIFAPDRSVDGIWFGHRGIEPQWPPDRATQTNTGLMLSEPYTEKIKYPPAPPRRYQMKDSHNFKTQNSFSAHDNRNSFQDHGVYFEDGHAGRVLGKRLKTANNRQHHTDADYIHHYYHGTEPGTTHLGGEYTPSTWISHRGLPTDEYPTHRRFPRKHREPVSGCAKLDTASASWFKEPDVPFYTPTHVLAVSQEPFLGPNKFKYSFHGLSKCYPSYERPENRKTYPVWMVKGSGKSRQLEA